MTPNRSNSAEKRVKEGKDLQEKISSKEKIFENFIKLYSKKIQAAQFGI